MSSPRIVKVKRLYTIPQAVLSRTFNKINSTQLTFGIHSEDNNNHSMRDYLSNQPYHKALYENNKLAKPIGNAELLAKHTKGFNSAIFIMGKKHSILVPRRPILSPMIKEAFIKNKWLIEIKLHSQLSFKDNDGIHKVLNAIAQDLSNQKVKEFVKNRGGTYWSKDAKHNNPYTAAIKFIETLGETGLGGVFNKLDSKIENIKNWENANAWRAGDMPLMDSMDLLNSIKVKVR